MSEQTQSLQVVGRIEPPIEAAIRDGFKIKCFLSGSGVRVAGLTDFDRAEMIENLPVADGAHIEEALGAAAVIHRRVTAGTGKAPKEYMAGANNVSSQLDAFMFDGRQVRIEPAEAGRILVKLIGYGPATAESPADARHHERVGVADSFAEAVAQAFAAPKADIA